MLTRVNSEEFSIFTQTLRKVAKGDEYERLKTIDDRKKLLKLWLAAIKDREIIVTWAEGDGMYSVVAKSTPNGDNAAPLPPIPLVHDKINDLLIPAQYHVNFYTVPESVPTLIELDMITNLIIRRPGLDDLLQMS